MNLRDSTIEDRDLPSALARGARQWAEGSGTRVDIDFAGSARKLPEEVELNIFRIAQEAVTNALKYAGASAIQIGLRVEHHRLELTVDDDGRGFDASGAFAMRNGHYGLLGMRERAEHMGGLMELTTGPTGGTVVKVTVPLSPQKNLDQPGWRRLAGFIKTLRGPLIP